MRDEPCSQRAVATEEHCGNEPAKWSMTVVSGAVRGAPSMPSVAPLTKSFPRCSCRTIRRGKKGAAPSHDEVGGSDERRVLQDELEVGDLVAIDVGLHDRVAVLV